MRLTKAERETVRMRFGGRCAYCGCELGPRWHADHLEPVQRELQSVRDGNTLRFKHTGRVHRPEHDHFGNLMPSCQPCNNYKHFFSLEEFRRMLQGTCGVLARSQNTYRHALRFGLVQETGAPVVFYFERLAAQAPDMPPLAPVEVMGC